MTNLDGLVNNELYKSPKTDSEALVQIKRSGLARILFWILWLFIIDFLVRISIGWLVGSLTGSELASPAEIRTAILSFFRSYGNVVILGEMLIWSVSCLMGYLPGTSKLKYVTRLELENMTISPNTDVTFERTNDVNENIRRYKKAQQDMIESIKTGKRAT